jgi:hypothetical protein
VEQYLPLRVDETDIHAPGMYVDTTVKLMLLGGESPEVSSSLFVAFPNASRPRWSAEGEASIIINGVLRNSCHCALLGYAGESV